MFSLEFGGVAPRNPSTNVGTMDAMPAPTALRLRKPRRVKCEREAFIESGSNFDYGGPLTEVALVGLAAIRCKGEKLQWDSAAGRFKNSDRANGMLKRTFRDGWTL